MKRLALLVLGLCLAAPVLANPTGAGLLTYPVEPCRILDTRISLGPITPTSGLLVFVRGSNLPAADGAANADCGVPLAAEAVVVNVVAVVPSAAGTLRLNGWGFIHGPMGAYSRLNYSAGKTEANEMTVSLCNAAPFPFAHVPCTFDNQGHYGDFSLTTQNGSLDVVIDVVGYLARP